MARQRSSLNIRLSRLISVCSFILWNVDVELTLVYDGKKVFREVTPTTKVSMLRSMISRSFGINARKRKIVVIDGDGGRQEIGESDALKDIGWFISGRKGEVDIR
jgi:hypothetical protein